MTSKSFGERYKSILKRYFDEPSEKELFDIAAMGRDLVRSSVPIEEVGQIFERALLLLKKDFPDRLPPTDVIERISVPLLELLMAYGLAWREKIAILEKEQEAQIRATKALREQTKTIRLSHRISVAAFEAATVGEALRDTLDRVCAYAEWPIGHAYLRAEHGARELVSTKLWHLDDPEEFTILRRVTEETQVAPGEGLCGRVLASKEPTWIVDVTEDPKFVPGQNAKELGVKAGFAFPVLVGGDVVAVLEFYSTEAIEPNPLILEVAIPQIGNLLGRVIERKRAEEELLQAQKMEAVGQLTGGIAHDFNNLMTVVQGNLELMREDVEADSDPDTIELMDDALSAARDGSELAHRLLAFSRKQSLNPTRIDTNELITEFSRLVRRTIGQDIEVKIELGDDVATVLADHSQLENALLNLCLNASHAMPGGGTLSLKTGNRRIVQGGSGDFPEVDPGDYVMVTVSDMGTGIPPEILARVFEPFFTTKEAGRGSGLGMSMVQGFANQSGGGIKIESEVGKGTDISLLLPIAPADARGQEVTEGSDDLPRGSETVLVVEDEPRIRRFAVRCLKDLGYRVLEAENATTARKILDSGASVDLLFSDIIMPRGVSGRELANTVTETYPGLKVQLATGFSRGASGEVREVEKRFPVVRKPYSKQQLARCIRAVLDAEE